MEYKKVEWSKMHRKNYDNSCEYCGGKCTDEESINSWIAANDNLELAERLGDTKKAAYYKMKMDERLTYRFSK